MKIVRKIFLSLFLSSSTISSISLFIAYDSYQKNLEDQFVKRYEAFSNVLSNSLTELEIKTDLIMSFASKIFQNADQKNGLMSTQDLKNLSKKLNMSHLFVIGSDGAFIRSTNEDPKLIPNLFTFCEAYRGLLNDSDSFVQTPIIPPFPELNPHKFLIVPNINGSRFLELGLKADFIGQTISKALNGDSNLKEISIYSPKGKHLGTYTSEGPVFTSDQIDVNKLASHEIQWTKDAATFTKRASASQPVCCQCVKTGLVSENDPYHYLIRTKISTEDLDRQKDVVKKIFAIIILSSFIISFIGSHILSQIVIKRLYTFNRKMKDIFEKNDLSLRSNLAGSDEVYIISKTFDELLSSLENYHRHTLDGQKKIAELDKESAILKTIASTVQMVVHDVRQPLDMMAKMLRRLSVKDGESTKPPQPEDIYFIELATKNAYGMLDDLLNVSPGRNVLYPESINIKEFFQEILNEFPEVKIEFSLDGEIQTRFDRLKLKRVIINIVKNAVEATNSKGFYWIEVSSSDKALQIEIGNLNSSLNHDQLAIIFESFFTSGKPSGYGLGTAIAKKFTEEHGGEIWCESNGWSSKGTSVPDKRDRDYVVFMIRLPQ